MQNVQLFQGDCLELMKEIPDKSVDLILADLPYGCTHNSWDKRIPFDLLWDSYNRIIKDNRAVVLFGQMPFTSDLISSNRKNFKHMWIWYKHYKRGFLNAKKRPLSTTENIVVFCKKQCVYNPQMTKGKFANKGTNGRSSNYNKFKSINSKNDMYYPTDILDFKGVPNGEVKHPTQKPVDLLEYLIKTYTDEGDVVLDNVMGSGTTGEACVNTNRRFIGMEVNEEYFRIAKERIEKAQSRA